MKMKRIRIRALRSLCTGCALTIMLAVPLPAGEDPCHADLRGLAADLAERFGSDQVELRAGGTAIEIERECFGARLEEAPPVFTSRIAPSAVLHVMNRERAAQGLPPFGFDARLALAAADRIEDMRELRYFAHVSPEGRKPFELILERGYDFREAGENLAAGFASAESVVAAWMKSPGHRANILSPRFEQVGVAICSDPPKDGMRGHVFVALYGTE